MTATAACRMLSETGFSDIDIMAKAAIQLALKFNRLLNGYLIAAYWLDGFFMKQDSLPDNLAGAELDAPALQMTHYLQTQLQAYTWHIAATKV